MPTVIPIKNNILTSTSLSILHTIKGLYLYQSYILLKDYIFINPTETDCKSVSPETMEIRLVAISEIENMNKLVMSLRTAQVNEYSLDKEHSSYDDLLGKLTL